VVWLVFAALWPHEPLIMIAAAAPLAVLAGDAFDDLVTRTDPAPVLAVVSATIVLLVARSYDLEPARLVAAHLGGTIASSPGELPPATLLGMVAVAAALGAAPIVGERYRLACVSLALAASGAVTLLAAHHGSAQVSRTGSLAAFDGIEVGLGISGHFTSMRELSDVAALDAYLAEGTCPTAVVVNESLPALERRARGRFFVLGDGVAGFRRVSACLPAGAQDANPLRGKLLAGLLLLSSPGPSTSPTTRSA
jgi:hypothetical protein